MIKNKKVIIMVCCVVVMIIGGVCLMIEKRKEDEEYQVISDMEKYDIGSKVSSGEDGAEEEDFIYIHIVGEVKNEGLVKLKVGARVVDAIDMAGGVTENADLSKVNLAYELSDGQKLRIPGVNDKVSDQNYLSTGSGESVSLEVDFSENEVTKKVNINIASQTELETLPGIGPSLANRIIVYRKNKGKFKVVSELKNVEGIGEAKFAVIKDLITVK